MMRIQSLCLLLIVALVSSAMGSTYSDLVLETSPVAYWDFQDGSAADLVNDPGLVATIYDGYPDTNDYYATATEVASLGSEASSPFLAFDADNKGIEKTGNYGYATHFSDTNLATGDYSVSFWFKSTDSAWNVSKINYIWGVNSGTGASSLIDGLFIGTGNYGTTSGVVGFYDNVNGVMTNSGTALSLDTWYNLTLVRSASSLDVYLNGTLVLDDAAASTTAGDTFTLGGRIDETSDSHAFSETTQSKILAAPGIYDEVAVWNTALDGNQVAAVYNAAFTAPTVPEPSTLVLLMTAAVGLLFRRRK